CGRDTSAWSVPLDFW
nr:immunoglobulin heavy chain junction region [Macaca mulatta]